MVTREAVKDAQIEIGGVDAAFYGIYNYIFKRTAIPEYTIHGILGMQTKFGIRIIDDCVTDSHAVSCRADQGYPPTERIC